MRKMRKEGTPRPKRKPRKKTVRERLMLSENKRMRVEMRKRRKQKGQPFYNPATDKYSPNIEAMFRKKRKA
jgi:hypothetical protein